MTSESPSTTAPGDIFATTHWTVVLAAGQRHTPGQIIRWKNGGRSAPGMGKRGKAAARLATNRAGVIIPCVIPAAARVL